MRLLPAERIIVWIVLGLAAIDLAALAVRPVRVDVAGYASAIVIGGLLFAAGQYYRVWRQEDKIALAATGASLFTLFTIVGSVFNYMLLPVPGERIDATLAAADALFGFHWPSAVNWVAQYPWLNQLLAFVYATSLPQLILVVLVLGFAGRDDQLHKFLLSGLIGALIAIGFWRLFPSAGASSVHEADELWRAGSALVADFKYVEEVKRVIAEGATELSPKSALGLIAFPSFHTVMACMAVFYMTQYRFLFVLLTVLNTLMLPAHRGARQSSHDGCLRRDCGVRNRCVARASRCRAGHAGADRSRPSAGLMRFRAKGKSRSHEDNASDQQRNAFHRFQATVQCTAASLQTVHDFERRRCSSIRGMISTKLHG